jgi:hypothetical protein
MSAPYVVTICREDDLHPIVDGLAGLPRARGLLAHADGLLDGMLAEGARLFPGLVWLRVDDASGPVAVVPLQSVVERRGVLTFRELRSPSRFEMLYHDAAVHSRAVPRRLLAALMSARACDGRPCDVLRLRDLRTGSPLAVMMASLASLLLETYPGTSVIPTPLAPGRWIDDQSRNLRSQVHKVTRRLEELGTVRVLESTAAAAVAAAFVRFVDLEAGGYKAQMNALRHEDADRKLLGAAIHTQAKHGGALVRELYLDDTLIASQVALRSADRLFLLKVAYDEHHARESPGTYLMADLLESCRRSALVSVLDCCVRQQWHDRWHVDIEPSYRVTIPNRRTVRGAMIALGRRTRRVLVTTSRDA